jgi:geranylgeranyl pyrophosphate synthase
VTEQSDQNNLLTDAAVQLFDAGGKRIRAMMSLLSAGIFEADHERSISLAAGVEMLHTATLVHDDLIDGSVLRRGKPTLNAGQHA